MTGTKQHQRDVGNIQRSTPSSHMTGCSQRQVLVFNLQGQTWTADWINTAVSKYGSQPLRAERHKKNQQQQRGDNIDKIVQAMMGCQDAVNRSCG
mmetsp:Transcript_7838/g.13450  ORF Transcript_7838/g.13450 Transcript_7838/m.13450 type:complete len:95 (+) Transcript_7838:32-316(+)